MRIITDELYARLVNELAKNETVAVFQQLLLSKRQDDAGAAGSGEEDGGEE